MTAPESTRAHWQSLFAEHQFLQRAQKREYANDRVRAAANPRQEAYLAMDGGSGFDFVLPHLSAASAELPSKALAASHTVPMKVMNGLVHGDSRSHVILSPGVIKGNASYVCECQAILVNAIFKEHGDVPPLMTVQLDNAPTNHNILVLVFNALYVLEQITLENRVRFELPNHAHDVYDSFHSIHARRVAASTFYSLQELDDIIVDSHSGARDAAARDSAISAAMGHDVLVSHLWKVRDFWDWLAPGYHSPNGRLDALMRAGFVYYDQISGLHDFLLKKEESSTPANVRVGLWAKRYMSSPSSEYRFLGTLVTRELFDQVVGERQPQFQDYSHAEQKDTREQKTVQKLESLLAGPFNLQFTPARLADALAMCRRDWGHFQHTSGAPWAPSSLFPKQCGALRGCCGRSKAS